MRSKKKGVYVSVRLLEKHTRTSEEVSRKPLLYGHDGYGDRITRRMMERSGHSWTTGVKPGRMGRAQGTALGPPNTGCRPLRNKREECSPSLATLFCRPGGYARPGGRNTC
jgi:hypothetical protein